MRKDAPLIALAIFALLPAVKCAAQGPWQRGPEAPRAIASTQTIQDGGATFQIDIAQGALDLPASGIVQWVRRAADAVTEYYGRFPVSRVRLLIVPYEGHKGVMGGTTWGNRDGFDGFSRLRVGQHVTQAELDKDWTLTHELVHMAFPNQADDQSWIEEGLATYVEPIARVQAGQLTAAGIWADMARDMPKGEPVQGDQGMDNTHTWGRTYWGGAMFCLVADVEIRRRTGNRKGLEDALRAIVREGGNIARDWPLPRVLAIGDKATGTTVLTEQYKRWSNAPSAVDLDALWKELGVRREGEGVALDPAAPLAGIREAITIPYAKPA
jgi:hypothetical protein